MTDVHKIENARTAREAADAAGRPHPRSSRTDDLEAGLARYLAAEAYHEKAGEDRERAEESESRDGSS